MEASGDVATALLRSSITHSTMKLQDRLKMISQRDITKGKVLISASAIIEGKGREILLIWEGDMPYHKWWVIPGGYVNPEETVKEAVVREVREETGLSVSIVRLINVYSRVFPERHDISIVYLCETHEDRVLLNSEHSEYSFFRVLPEGLHPFLAEVIKDLGDTH